MKKTIPLIVVGLALSHAAMAQDSVTKARYAQTQKVEAYYAQAERAYSSGNLQLAQQSVQAALKLNPRHGPSYALAQKLKNSGDDFKIKAREHQLSQVILKNVDIDDMNLPDALTILGKLVEETSNDKVIPNFVVQDKSKILSDKRVTVKLKNVPASVVLEYLLEQAYAVCKYDVYAITVRPRAAK